MDHRFDVVGAWGSQKASNSAREMVCRELRLKIAVAAVLLAAMALASVAKAANFVPSGTARVFSSAPSVSESRFQARVGPSTFDRIALHRIAPKTKSPEHPGPVMLYLPGTNMNGEIAPDDPHHNLPLYLAARGVDVWTLDYRTHFIPPGTPIEKLGELKGWTNDLFESDIDAAVKFILAQTNRRRLFLAGFSRGVDFAYLYAALHPERVAGLVILDGAILKPRTAGGAPASYATDVGGKHLTYDKRKALLELVIKNPDAPAPIPKYKTARENLEHVVYDAAGFGGHGGLANPQGGFSDVRVMAPVLLLYDRYWPAVQDVENPFSAERIASLQRSKIPVIAFASTNMFKDWADNVKESAASTGSKDVTFKQLDGWGHLDVICGTKAETEVYAPIALWLKQHPE